MDSLTIKAVCQALIFSLLDFTILIEKLEISLVLKPLFIKLGCFENTLSKSCWKEK